MTSNQGEGYDGASLFWVSQFFKMPLLPVKLILPVNRHYQLWEKVTIIISSHIICINFKTAIFIKMPLDLNIYPQTMHRQLRWLWIGPAIPLEKHVEKGVESNWSGDVNKPDRGDRNNTKQVQNNTVAASFSFENQKGFFTNIHRDNRNNFQQKIYFGEKIKCVQKS